MHNFEERQMYFDGCKENHACFGAYGQHGTSTLGLNVGQHPSYACGNFNARSYDGYGQHGCRQPMQEHGYEQPMQEGLIPTPMNSYG